MIRKQRPINYPDMTLGIIHNILYDSFVCPVSLLADGIRGQ